MLHETRKRVGPIGAAVVALALAFSAAPAGSDDARARDWRHVREVLFGAMPESTYKGLWVNRWTEPPVLMLFGGTDEDRAFVERTVGRFNRLLAEHPIRIEVRDEGAVNLALMFASQGKMPAVARRHGMRADMARLGVGYTETLIRPDHAIRGALTLIMDELEAAERRATIIHELYHALGPGGHSTVHADSVVYDGGAAGSRATELAAIDVKVLALIYRHLAPGATEDAVRAAFDAHWDSLEAAPAQYSASSSGP